MGYGILLLLCFGQTVYIFRLRAETRRLRESNKMHDYFTGIYRSEDWTL